MAWRDELRQASFRGVEFKVEAHDTTGGRRVVKHEFPLRDVPFVEDMGRKGKEFTVDAYLVGENYTQARDQLIRACDEEGPGELVHPYLGTLKVACSGFSFRESKNEGGFVRFSLSFIESGEAQFPAEASNASSLAAEAADAANIAIAGDFAEVFTIDGLPDFVSMDAESLLSDAVDSIAEVASGLIDGVGGVTGFISQCTTFQGQIGGLLSAPSSLASQLIGILADAVGLSGNTFGALRGLFSLFDYGSDWPEIPQTTSTRVQQARNQQAIRALVRRAAVVEAARLAPNADYETRDDALVTRDRIADRLDEEMETAGVSDTVFQALQQTRFAVVRGVPPANVALPNLVTLTPVVTVPALLLAYDLYEDPTREAEIVRRNRLRHPGFVPGAQPLQVTADA